MANNYQTGTATDPQHLKTIIDSFLGGLGWSIDAKTEYNGGIPNGGSATDAQTYYTTYYTKNARIYFLTHQKNSDDILGGPLKEYVNPIVTIPDVPTGNEVYSIFNQESYSSYAQTNDIEGPFTAYHFFEGTEGDGGIYFYCVLETVAGVFAHFGMGELDKVGTLPAQFVVCTYWDQQASVVDNPLSGSHSSMFDGLTSPLTRSGLLSCNQLTAEPNPEYYRFGYETYSGGGINYYKRVRGGVRSGLNAYFHGRSPNAFNGRALLQPNYIDLYDTNAANGGWYRRVGLAPAFRSTMIQHLQAGDIVDTDWMVFPIKAKSGADGENNSNYYGHAYKWQ